MRKGRPYRDSNRQSSDSKSDALSVGKCGLEVASTLNNLCLFSDTSKYIMEFKMLIWNY